MANKVNIFDDEWCEILFEARNQDYGAYVLRKDSGNRHMLAILVTLLIFAVAVLAPTLIKKVIPKNTTRNVEVTELANIKIDNTKKPEDAKEIVVKEYKPVRAAIRFVPPVIKPDEEVSNMDTIKTQEQLSESRGVISTITQDGVTDNPDAVNPDVIQIIEDTAKTVYQYVEQMPEFPGGTDELMAYLRKNTVYPTIAQENGISGRVYVQFVVNKNGEIVNIKVVRGVDVSLDREAVRVIQSMPRWKPGKQNGNSVRVQMSLPVNFKLE